MIDTKDNPSFLNSFLDYSSTILNKSSNTIKEYNYDLAHFLKYISYIYKLSDEKEIKDINISTMTINDIKKVTLDDIHGFLFYLKNTFNSKPATRASKVASIRMFF